MNTPNIHNPKGLLSPDELRAMQSMVQKGLIDLLGGDGNIPQFKPYIEHSELDDRITFLAEPGSYHEPMEATSAEMGIEMKLRKEFPDPIEKARGKSIELHDTFFPKGFFWLRANSKCTYLDEYLIVGFLIQGMGEVVTDRQFDQIKGRSILEDMLAQFKNREGITADEAYSYFNELVCNK